MNNAGNVAFGALEENTYASSFVTAHIDRSLIHGVCSPEESLDQFNTNLFGGMNVARAFLPYMRPRKTGTIVWIGSLAGYG